MVVGAVVVLVGAEDGGRMVVIAVELLLSSVLVVGRGASGGMVGGEVRSEEVEGMRTIGASVVGEIEGAVDVVVVGALAVAAAVVVALVVAVDGGVGRAALATLAFAANAAAASFFIRFVSKIS